MTLKGRVYTLALPAMLLAAAAFAQDDSGEARPVDDAAATDAAAAAPDADAPPALLDQVVPVAEDDAGEAAGAEDAAADTARDGATVGPPEAAVGAPEQSPREQLVEEFRRFKELRDEGMLDEAENTAKRAVELSIGLSGPRSNETAKALTNLGAVQYDTRNFDAAKQNFQQAIDIYIENEDRLSERLINPLRGLGAAQLESGRPDLALATYNQAMHVSHVNEGPHNIEQVPILEAIAETHLRMGEPDEAKDSQDMIYALTLRHLDGDNMQLIPPLMRRAAWQRRTGYVLDERATYRRVIRIIEDERGSEDLELIDPLMKLAESYFYTDTSDPASLQAASVASGEMFFKRAIRIAEDNPDSNWQLRAKTMLALADYYNFRSDLARARRSYRDVWDFLSEDDTRLDVRHDELEQVHVLNEDPIPQYVGDATLSDRQQADKDIREGSVIVSFNVSARGRMAKLEVVELNPPVYEDMRDRVVRELRHRIYRPRFKDGEPISTKNQVVTHRFFYLQSDLEQRQAAANGDNAES